MPRGHCLDYWHKWKREYNFCGLRPQDAKENDRYLELVDKIASNGAKIDGDFILEHFTAGAARPLLRCKDDAIAGKALAYVTACLKRGEDVTGGDLAATIAGFQGKPESTHLRTSPSAQRGVSAENQESAVPPAPVTLPCKVDLTKPAGGAPLSDRMKESEPHGTETNHSPFKTGLQVKEGIAGEMFPAAVKDPVTTDPPAKTDKELFLVACEEAYDHGKPDFRQAVDDLMRYHPSWKNPGTVIYFCVTNPREAIMGGKK